ncbi:hypothetical protein [Aquimarina brevivitae]|uniref:Uncharacterized protein n=1 Tax=Aquimarina brevivitae TaxID=323412 RepID=A0A4Q7P277_9FLAO|nr:hypothetical protein [Aquimarina brevivitae]RZS93981.1 hypothetical protein EV197_2563 [Aquimarina brevivitae]
MKLITGFLFIILVTTFTAYGQTIEQQYMEKLKFIVGDWVGVSAAYEEGKIKVQVPAYEKISYQLDKSIITIDLKSESLQLHTVIYYDAKDKTYYYNSYYQTGAGRYKATLSTDNKFIVNASPTKRFIFHAPTPDTFQEYGEKLVDGKWIKYFEDNFTRIE